MANTQKYVVKGSKVKCDCGAVSAYLRTLNKYPMIGSAAYMSDTDTSSANFVGDFGRCYASHYANKDGSCSMDLLSHWFGSHEKVVFKHPAFHKYVQNYNKLIKESYDSVKLINDALKKLSTATNTFNFFMLSWSTPFSDVDKALSNVRALQKQIDGLRTELKKYGTKSDQARRRVSLDSAEEKLKEAGNFINLLNDNKLNLGHPLLDGSVLIGKKGGVIYISETGQTDSNGNYLHGFTEDRQYIYYHGLKYKVHVPEQPQGMEFSKISQSWGEIATQYSGKMETNIWFAIAGYTMEEIKKEAIVVGKGDFRYNIEQSRVINEGLAAGYGLSKKTDKLIKSMGRICLITSIIDALHRFIRRTADVKFKFFVVSGERRVVIQCGNSDIAETRRNPDYINKTINSSTLTLASLNADLVKEIGWKIRTLLVTAKGEEGMMPNWVEPDDFIRYDFEMYFDPMHKGEYYHSYLAFDDKKQLQEIFIRYPGDYLHYGFYYNKYMKYFQNLYSVLEDVRPVLEDEEYGELFYKFVNEEIE